MRRGIATAPSLAGALGLAALLSLGVAPSAGAEPEPSGLEIARRNNARDDGAQVSRTFEMELVSKRGKVRRRVTRIYRRDFDQERRSILFFEAPTSLEGTALLTYDYSDTRRDDDQWIFLPALRKSRRIATADRGAAFLGTDLSYEDIKKETRLSLGEYKWANLGGEAVDGNGCWKLEAIPIDDEVARVLRYSRVVFYIDAAIWMPRRVEYWNLAGQALKTVSLLEIREVEGVWTAHRIEAKNHRSGHRTNLIFRDVDYHTELDTELFTQRALSRGAR